MHAGKRCDRRRAASATRGSDASVAEEHRAAHANLDTNLDTNLDAHCEADNLEARRTISRPVNAAFIMTAQPAGRTVRPAVRR